MILYDHVNGSGGPGWWSATTYATAEDIDRGSIGFLTGKRIDQEKHR